MNIRKIKDDVFEKIGINKYEFFVSAMDYINDFPDIINEFYTDATETSSGEYLGFLINGGWNNEDETAVYISEYDYLNNVEIRVYFSYEEILQYFLMYYFKNIHCYPDMIAFIEQEFVNYTNYIGESKKYKIDLDVKSIFVRDKLRDFLLKYNYESNKYNLGIINFKREAINYWDKDILKLFFSYLMGENILKNFLNGKNEFFEKEREKFGHFDERELYFNIMSKGDKNIIFYYYTGYKNGKIYEWFDRKKYNNMMSDFILEKEIKTLISERFKGKREKENVEIISKEDFLKELQVIVTAYENIYNDSGIQEMFEKYKKKLSFK